jgi:hypothetical protein
MATTSLSLPVTFILHNVPESIQKLNLLAFNTNIDGAKYTLLVSTAARRPDW